MNPGDQYYLYSHFTEIQDLENNDTREFDLLWNGDVTTKAFIPSKLVVDTIPDISPRTCDGGLCTYKLRKTSRSTLPPLLNALEIYTVIEFPQSETYESDVVAVKNIGAVYELGRISWQGDPCVPHQYAWDALNCSNTDISTPPRITFLNLSSSGLTGTIAAAIQNLTELEKLDLSNNKLTGMVPEFLAKMKSLFIINLSGNDLNGSLPQALLQRKGLELLIHGNSRLWLSVSCTEDSKKKTFSVVIVASVASVAIVVAVLVLFFVLKKKKRSTVEGPPLSKPTVDHTYVNSYEPSIKTKKEGLLIQRLWK